MQFFFFLRKFAWIILGFGRMHEKQIFVFGKEN
jgi:hypothetical protein